MAKEIKEYKPKDLLVTEKSKNPDIPQDEYSILLIANEDLESILKILAKHYSLLKKKREEYMNDPEKPNKYKKNDLSIPKLVKIYNEVTREQTKTIILNMHKNKKKLSPSSVFEICKKSIAEEHERRKKEEKSSSEDEESSGDEE